MMLARSNQCSARFPTLNLGNLHPRPLKDLVLQIGTTAHLLVGQLGSMQDHAGIRPRASSLGEKARIYDNDTLNYLTARALVIRFRDLASQSLAAEYVP